MKFFDRLSLVHQTAIILFSLTLSVFVCFTGYVAWDTHRNLVRESEKHLEEQVELISSMFRFYDRTLRHETERLGKIFFTMFPGELNLSPWETMKVAGIDSPVLKYDGSSLNLDFEKVDYFTDITGGAATVFVRDGDDFLRITTSLKKENGDRAIGTYLGKNHPGYENFMQGKNYFGRAHLFGRDYMTQYIPVKSVSGDVIAILFIGFDYSEGLASLRKTVNSLKIGETGHAYVVDKSRSSRGRLVMHPTRENENISIFFGKDSQKNINDLYRKTSGTFIHTVNTDSGYQGERLAAYQSVDTWNWVVVAEASVKELATASTNIRNTLIFLSVFVCALMTVLIYLVLRHQLLPLIACMPKLERIGNGDLTQKLDIRGQPVPPSQAASKNEIRALCAHVNDMVERFRSLVAGVLDATTAVRNATDDLDDTARENSSGLSRQQSETDNLASAINEMAASVQEVANSAAQASDETRLTDELAAKGKETMSSTMAMIHNVAEEIGNAVNVIDSVKSDSQAIGTVLDVIQEIAEQTNLLALNAAIEAARAGEQGRGFAVVADEVRTLAQRSQQSTTEINDIIGRLQKSVETAVMVMHDDRAKSEAGVERVNEAAQALTEITESVSRITRMNAQVAVATDQQSKVANEINQNILNIKEVTEHSARNSENTSTSVADLNRQSIELQEQLSKFNV